MSGNRVPDFSQARVLVFGDVMLDEYVVGDVTRISPEAPIPVFLLKSKYQVPGGASNVAANVAALGARVTLCGIVGNDASGANLQSALAKRAPGVNYRPIVEADRATTLKTRYLAGGHHVLRVDSEVSQHISAETSRAAADILQELLPDCDAVIVSDYAKGAVVETTYLPLIEAAKRLGKPVFVDPKRRDFGFYAGATFLTPNRRELHDATGLSVLDDAAIEHACRAAASATGASLLVTRSEQGMTLFQPQADALHIHATAREVFDVSGAGDTVIATFASACALGLPAAEAAELANVAAGLSVGKQGTSTVSAAELAEALRAAWHPGTGRSDGLMDRSTAALQCREWRTQGLRVAFTNGCFDILHCGHVQLLDEVSQHCDRLIVGLNSDASVRVLKGPTRPVNPSAARARVLLGLRSVDAVVVFEEETPARLIEALSPDLLAKGGDYQRHQIVGADWVERHGGKVLIVRLVDGYSTTSIIESLAAGAESPRAGAASRHAAE